MNRSVPLLMLLFLALPGINLPAQQAKADTGHKPAKKVFKPTSYLGRSEYSSGAIQKSVLDNLLKQGISSHDSTGRKYKVISFDFAYAERNLYEDSVGNLMVMSDYLNGHCNGDTLAASISNTIYDRTKAGDTVYMDNILVVPYKNKSNEPLPDSTAFLARNIKLVIVK